MLKGDSEQFHEILTDTPAEAARVDANKRSVMHAAAYLGETEMLEK